MSNGKSLIQIPAIGLLVTGILNVCVGVLIVLSALTRLAGITKERVPTDEAERLGYYIATFGSYGIGLLSLLLAPIIIYGAIQMLNGKKLGLAKTAAILAIIPFTSSCCLIGVVFGIWALVVFGKPEVKDYFANR
jgi:hypothetical protein